MSAPPWQAKAIEASGSGGSKWEAYKAPDGRIYWSDGSTSVWEKPDELKTEEEIAIARLNWREYTAPGGRKYWYNKKSGESVWNMPEECKKVVESLNAKKAMKIEEEERKKGEEKQLELREDMLVIGGEGKSQSIALENAWMEEKVQCGSFEEAEMVFIKMLKRNGVASDWTWEQTMRAVIKQPQYRAIKDPIQRKLTFEKYISEMRKQESEKEQDRLAKLKTDFNRLLRMHSEIKYYTRWKVAREILEGEPAFKATENEEEKRQLFEEYVAELKRIENENEQKVKREAMDSFLVLLESLKLKPYSRWSNAQAKFLEHPEFKTNPKFKILSNLDILVIYESHIKELEREFINKRQENKAKKQRTERKNREAFMKLLQDLRHEKKIGPGTKWMTIYPIIKNDARYKNMLGQSGSTPLDLFWDIVEDAERDMRHKKNLALDIMEEQKIDFDEKISLSQFSEIINRDKRGAELSESTLSFIYNMLRERVFKRLEDEKRSDERRRKRRISALRYVIKHLRPSIQLDSTWSDVKKRIEHTEEFLAIESEEDRELAFKKQLRRLKEKDVSLKSYHKSNRSSKHFRYSSKNRDTDSREFNDNLHYTKDYHGYRNNGYRNHDSENENDSRYRKRIKSDKDYYSNDYNDNDRNTIESSEEGEIH
ncbi:hypothetical protein T552_02478 [Pneumocystis carinii B80]|uniref:WW domain-containing protein n=1 Tax=Pneumocystis carinii (strain B80) TaxID=1408658 RepID=A0A0W4ZF36_PNEC8|nr:hypothetical protein T552_02478 [Pneumocystis carinii B80]KTW26987.1 hypothetical protein T552_02478 [Pneumocystis carinii B80]